ncbi:uncharacterized protein LOC129606881 [Condylostylus longicornis]|uniref:uncharacterized protein LOC129606881 n=1 Tax=Condylostylus longicornis TaxID=2530218 RepID=UPI00244D9A87|nr:uncharacterized protein LOC129606881 [Condylostylus longicornis]
MPALEEYELTEAEKLAKQQFRLYYKEAYFIPCDIDNIDVLPSWYDEEKYKRGQKYFQENRSGILTSNLIGLICLLAEPKGLKILSSTGKSSTKETAKKRYLSTVLHTLKWYEIDLTPGSESRKSLATVRKLHFAASNSANEKKIGHITQTELSLTAFGFMGLVLVRADILGIHTDNQEDREAFVHLWAVLCNLLGVQDKYNICLLRFDVLEILCQMFIRYVLIPIIQIELPEFKQMTQCMLDGVGEILPHMDYESQLFSVKLVLGLPGYQYKVGHDKALLCRSILNQNDIDDVNIFLRDIKTIDYFRYTIDIPIIEIHKIDKYTTTITNEIKQSDLDINKNINLNITNIEMNELEKKIHSNLQLSNTECIKIYYIDYEEEWMKCLNNDKFYQLSAKAQRIINFKSYGRTLLDYKIPRYLVHSFMSFLLNRIRKQSVKDNSNRNITKSKSESILIK